MQLFAKGCQSLTWIPAVVQRGRLLKPRPTALHHSQSRLVMEWPRVICCIIQQCMAFRKLLLLWMAVQKLLSWALVANHVKSQHEVLIEIWSMECSWKSSAEGMV
mmetsp:Transcript_155320/g.289759  ORF Transcript_155320/g.289759 Transcript_155320/m.289759 type:complete len:105 (+) Transcript_155320:1018-1332(+)